MCCIPTVVNGIRACALMACLCTGGLSHTFAGNHLVCAVWCGDGGS